MGLGSTVLFDNHFNIAHFLKLISYLAPLAGLVLDYRNSYRGSMRDANERKTAELALLQAKDDAVTAGHAKTEFLANMSHEIRTPLTAILGYADLLIDSADEKISDEQTEALQTIQNNGTYLLHILNDILDLSKIEANKLSVEQIPCSPFTIVRDVAALMEVRAKEKDLYLEFQYINSVPETIQTDPIRLKQVLINLIGNAIKFTNRGDVLVLIAFAKDSEADAGTMKFSVQDQGVGIGDQHLGRIFNPFSQADASTTREFGGTGLGLAICKRLTKLLGGDIEAESELGKGSTFTFWIPTGPLDGVPIFRERTSHRGSIKSREAPKRSLADLGVKLLLVEDNPVNQKLVEKVLNKAGAAVKVVSNGQEGVDAALGELEAGAPYDVILMDMQMPVLDGYQATRTLRKEGYDRLILALTANVMEQDRAKCELAGCDAFSGKPVDRDDLIGKIRELATAKR